MTPEQQKEILRIAWELYQGGTKTVINIASEMNNLDGFSKYYHDDHRKANWELVQFINSDPAIMSMFNQLDEDSS